MNTAPIVSVVMPAYNHANFIVEAMRSVLDQSFDDLEFLVGDDGSQDGTAERARSIEDFRLEVISHGVNRGAAVVHNDLISRARGRYVAVLNSDDAWLPGKLAKQVHFLQQHPDIGACFGRASFFDRHGAHLTRDSLSFGRVFDVENRTRGAWLRQFFLRGNCLCHPTLLIRRELYEKLGLYDNRLRQLPDLDMWIRLVKFASIHIFDEELVRFRVLPGENASAKTAANSTRVMNEQFFIARRFFNGVPPELMRQGFADLLINPEMPTDAHLEIEKAFLFLQPARSLTPCYRVIGLSMLHDLLACPIHRSVLEQDYGFDDRALQKLAAEVTTFADAPWKKKTGFRKLLQDLRTGAKGVLRSLSGG